MQSLAGALRHDQAVPAEPSRRHTLARARGSRHTRRPDREAAVIAAPAELDLVRFGPRASEFVEVGMFRAGAAIEPPS